MTKARHGDLIVLQTKYRDTSGFDRFNLGTVMGTRPDGNVGAIEVNDSELGVITNVGMRVCWRISQDAIDVPAVLKGARTSYDTLDEVRDTLRPHLRG